MRFKLNETTEVKEGSKNMDMWDRVINDDMPTPTASGNITRVVKTIKVMTSDGEYETVRDEDLLKLSNAREIIDTMLDCKYINVSTKEDDSFDSSHYISMDNVVDIRIYWNFKELRTLPNVF